jgi:hypothetical protein
VFYPKQTGRLTVGRNITLTLILTSSQSRVAVAEARRQVGNPEERERPPLEAITRRLAKTQQTENTEVCVLVKCKVRELVKLL